MNLIQYLLHRATWEKLPPLPRMYSSEYQVAEVERDVEMLMRQTHARCPAGVKVLEQRYRLSARELIEQLPARRRKRRIGARAMAVLRRALGLMPYDPMKRFSYEHRHIARRDGRR